MDSYADTMGEIRMFAGDYAPVGWLLCNGQLLSIASYPALYNLIGTTYGGNGTTNFAVPDLRSRVPICAGQGTGLPNYALASTGGTETNTLTVNNMPAHTHGVTGTAAIMVSTEDGHSTLPGGNYPAVNGSLAYSSQTDGQMAATADTIVANAGNSTPLSNVQPYLAVNFIICYSGIYPT
jgi:microcystin-dependent protein